jgi:hypothetical protein
VWVPLLLVVALPLHAQFTTYGCPSPSGPPLNGFTAGTQSASQICMSGSFGTSLVYDVTLTDNSTGQQTTVTGAASGTLLMVTVPASFYATVQTPGQPDPVSIAIVPPQVPKAAQTGTFQTNPPMTAGAPVFVSAVNQPVTWQLYTGGTGPYLNELESGTPPPGMPQLPMNGQTWTGTPNQAGTFTFSILGSDGWGNVFYPNLAAYIVAVPAIASLSASSANAGNSGFPINVTGTGFEQPQTIMQTNEPGSQVYLTNGSTVMQLTPSSVTSTQLTVNLPASLFLTTGIWTVTVVNPGSVTSNSVQFQVDPTITALSTSTRTVGQAPFPLQVTGVGFVNGSVVYVDGKPVATTFQNATSLVATLPTISSPSTVLVTVHNPDTTFTQAPTNFYYVAAPTAVSLNPSSVNAGSATFPLTVTGANLTSGMTVYFNTTPLSTTFNQLGSSLVGLVPASAVTTAGTAAVTVGTLDNYYTPPLTFTINSTGPPPLQLQTFSPLPAGTVNTAYSVTFTATQGTPPYAFSVISGSLPTGLQLSPAGVLNGTPTAFGPSLFTVQVADSAKTTVARQFALNIAPAPLTITTGPLSNTQVNMPVSVQFAGAGGVPPYTFVEFGALPPGVQISSSGLLSGTPTKAGSFPFRLFIDDSTSASASGSFTLNVALPGLLITPPSPLPAGEINVPYTAQMAATGGVGAPFIWSATGLPNGLTIANNSGLIAGIPRQAGSFTVAVTVGDYSGATVTQSYVLAIASASVTVSGSPLPNGAVGSSYTGALTASGGTGAFTFTATGLPTGLTLSSSGVVSGTPSAAGNFSVTATATDSAGATASMTFRVTIAPQLTVTATAIPNATAGTAISPIQLTATGGTPPYQWQSATVPAGLTLALDGTLSGTPATAGTFPFTVFAVDSNGSLASGAEQLIVALPSLPAASITGLPKSAAPATQQFLQVALANPFPSPVTANLTLTFAPTTGADDPSVQFSTGGRAAQIIIPAGSSAGVTDVGVQTGTVAGTITISAQLFVGTANVTPSPAPSTTIAVTAGAPSITRVTATRTASGFIVTVTGFASNRGVDTAVFTFVPSEGSNLQTTTLSLTDTSLFTAWYSSSASAPFGSQFTLTQPFNVNGSASSVQSVSTVLTNALGTSTAVSTILQ